MEKRVSVGNLPRGASARLDGGLFEGGPLPVGGDDQETARVRAGRAVRRLLGYARYARDHVGAVAVSLFFFNDETGDLQGVLAEWDWTRSSFPSRASDWPTVAAALAKRELRVITKGQASGAEVGWFEARGILGSVCVPLCSDERRLGILFFDFDASTAPVDRADLSFLGDVGERCARALARTSPSQKAQWSG